VEYYEDFPQLENGVGLVALFRKELEQGLGERWDRLAGVSSSADKSSGSPVTRRIVHVATGVDAAPFLKEAAARVAPFYGVELRVHGVPNRFFGESVTVAGLVTGQDLVAALRQPLSVEKENREDIGLFIPSCMLKADEEVFLDGMTLPEIEEALGRRTLVVLPTGEGLLSALDAWTGKEAV
jgi:NifB/MoaA-like Fe-S oxidoreductase